MYGNISCLFCLKMLYILFRSIFIKAKNERLLSVLNELTDGLKIYGLLYEIRKHPNIFKNVFCCNDNLFQWHFREFQKWLKPNFTPEGSNRKSVEVATLKHFLDFFEQCFNDGKCFLVKSSLLLAVTKFIMTKPYLQLIIIKITKLRLQISQIMHRVKIWGGGLQDLTRMRNLAIRLYVKP